MACIRVRCDAGPAGSFFETDSARRATWKRPVTLRAAGVEPCRARSPVAGAGTARRVRPEDAAYSIRLRPGPRSPRGKTLLIKKFVPVRPRSIDSGRLPPATSDGQFDLLG